jgi:hypothetical protein
VEKVPGFCEGEILTRRWSVAVLNLRREISGLLTWEFKLEGNKPQRVRRLLWWIYGSGI